MITATTFLTPIALKSFPSVKKKTFLSVVLFAARHPSLTRYLMVRYMRKRLSRLYGKSHPSERNTYEKAALKAHGSIQHDNIAKKSRARIEEALAIVNSSADEMSDNEYNILLIFAFLCGRSSSVLSYLNPILGLDRFRPGSQGRPADPQYDTERVYENVTKMFKSFVTTRNPDPDSIGSDANYVASFMRSDDMLPARKTTKSIIRAIIGNISIQALCVSPGKAYLDVIRKIVSMYE